MADKTAKRPLRVETDTEKVQRHKHLLFSGAPMPEGWKLPPLTEPPNRSDPDGVRRADREIESLKTARFESWRRVPFDAGVAIEPGQKGVWGDMAEFGRLDLMQHWVNWHGVSRADRAGMMSAQLDLEKLSPDLRDHLRKDAALHPPGAGRVEGQGFEATPHRVRSPSEIAQQSRSAGPQQAAGKANGQSHEKDRNEGR